MEHYSPLRYPGGKAKLAPFIAAVMRRNGHVYPEYVEPYAGGAGVALHLLFEEYADRVIINDADPRIHCFWVAATQYTEEFVELVRVTPVSVDEWYRQREIYTICDMESPLLLGFATFFLNRTGRSGITHSGGPIGGYDQTGTYKIDARFNRDDLCRRLVRIGAFADRIEAVNKDGLRLLERLAEDRSRIDETVVYLDPPYHDKSDELYLNHFTDEQHGALARFLRKEAEFAWILTYDDAPAIRELYRESPQMVVNLKYSAYKSRKGWELLIHPPSMAITKTEQAVLPRVGRGSAK
ncbi:DNA adenine methylase [Candidatus Palauibacter sp.]|uniref:DNA adenine methylase n=1 Tax=Candidatus Palauibacter sp. TaxID=3101350 RepID=UPI003B597520